MALSLDVALKTGIRRVCCDFPSSNAARCYIILRYLHEFLHFEVCVPNTANPARRTLHNSAENVLILHVSCIARKAQIPNSVVLVVGSASFRHLPPTRALEYISRKVFLALP